MKAIIENPIKVTSPLEYESTLYEFNLILNKICVSENEIDLRSSIYTFENSILGGYKHFMYGFGSSHMWVKQIINGEPKQQVIFVKF